MSDGITSEQREALGKLAGWIDPSAYLGGGVAVAIRHRHRLSRDLDLFVREGEPESIAELLADAPDVRVLSRAPGTLHLEVSGVPASILRYRYPLLAEPEELEDLPVRVASADDLLCMKLSAIGNRGARRDFWDLHTMLTDRALDLGIALGRFREKFASIDVGHVVRALVYFADAEAEPFPPALTPERWARITSDLRTWVKAL